MPCLQTAGRRQPVLLPALLAAAALAAVALPVSAQRSAPAPHRPNVAVSASADPAVQMESLNADRAAPLSRESGHSSAKCAGKQGRGDPPAPRRSRARRRFPRRASPRNERARPGIAPGRSPEWRGRRRRGVSGGSGMSLSCRLLSLIGSRPSCRVGQRPLRVGQQQRLSANGALGWADVADHHHCVVPVVVHDGGLCPGFGLGDLSWARQFQRAGSQRLSGFGRRHRPAGSGNVGSLDPRRAG